MKASETIMQGKIISLNKHQQAIVDKLLEKQAEVSFKAGIREVVDWVNFNSREISSHFIGHSKEYTVEQLQVKLKEWRLG